MLRNGDPSPASRPPLRAALILAGLATAFLARCAVPTEQSNRQPAPSAGRLVFTQVPVGSGFDLPAGSRIVSFDPSRPQEGVTVLTGGFSAAGRPDVSFDGQRLLFVGRRSPDEPLAVWEMNADGSGVRQITSRMAGIREAIYLSSIYTIDDHEPADQIAFCADDPGGAASLYTCRMDGTRISRITFDPYGATDPCQLSDGRLLYSGGPGSALMTVNTDGTDVFVFGAAREPVAFRGMPCETPDGLVVFVEARGGSPDRGGALVAVSRRSSLHSRRVAGGGRNRPARVVPGPRRRLLGALHARPEERHQDRRRLRRAAVARARRRRGPRPHRHRRPFQRGR